MAAKLLHTLADDNPDLKKQIGCMTGIFQLFDRQQLITAKRITGYSPKKLTPPGSSHFNNGGYQQEPGTGPNRSVAAENQMSKYVHDKHKVSTESSRPSFSSSSRSSSFSSLDCNRMPQPESSSHDRIIFPDSKEQVISLPTEFYQSDQQHFDLRDVVKDSIYKETQGLSVRISTGYGAMDSLKKNRNSPRPAHVLNPDDGYCGLGPRELSRSSSYNARDAPRFSYDGRDSFKSYLKQKELPRLSLDSKEALMRNLKDFEKESDHVNNLNKAPVIQSRPPSVVAKLMGLEMMPESALTRTSPAEDAPSFSRPSEESDLSRPISSSTSSKNSWREPNSPRWKNSDYVRKPISRFPIEPAPWKHLDGTRGAQKPAQRNFKDSSKKSGPIPSVYGEIEKRLKDIEFSSSGKDLRALKQILEAMQEKVLLEGKEVGKPQVGQVTTSLRKGSSSNRNFESPIVIMKPAKLIDKSGVPSSSIIPLHSIPSLPALQYGDSTNAKSGKVYGRATKDQVSKTIHDVKSNKKPSNSTHSSIKGSGSVSPRTQQKKPELDKIPRPPTPPDANRPRRQSGRLQKESNSPGGRSRTKYPDIQSSDRMTELISESRDLRSQHTGNQVKVDQSASEKKSLLVLNEDESVAEMTADTPEYPSPVSVLDRATYDDDSPSPLKQIVKTVKGGKPLGSDKFFKTGQLSSAIEVESNNARSGLSSDSNRKKFQNVENLVQKLRRLNSNHDEARTDYIASLCENTNPDDVYISEVLLTSGLLLRDLGSSLTTLQLHSSGNPINPELFLVLEQTKASRLTKQCSTEKVMKDKFHRKLVFDSVSEILGQKLFAARASAEPWLRPHTLAKKTLNSQKLLRELCSEVEQLQTKKPEYVSEDEENDDGLKVILWEDVMNRSESWTDYKSEISGIVLDVERSIFKELVDEVVIGESAGLKIRPVRRRELFRK